MTGSVATHLNADGLARALRSGIHRVIDEQDFLNRINVFPVADGDTGTNLSLSLGAVLPVLDDSEDAHLGTLLAKIADALLDGSRGNSGAIVAQFFQGMSDSAGEITRFTTYTFGKAAELGSEYAHDALEKPREGTILSVISAFANSIRSQTVKDEEERFPDLVARSIEAIETALEETPAQLEVLRKAGVVDAGAKGFVTLIKGMAEFIIDGTIAPKPDLKLLFDESMSFDTSAEGGDSAYRYCTECIVNGTDIDRRKLREALSEIGDSLVLAGTKRKAKIHIHVDEPEDVFDLARKFGQVSAEKADDMHRQHTSSHNSARRFAVITDSAADIADEDLERLDIHMVPLRIQFGERGYLDKVSISANEFFEELRTNPNHPTSSQPAPGDFRRQFQFLASHFADVLSVTVTGRVSGTFQAAQSAAERIDAPGRIRVIDSLNASTGQGLIAVFAAECSALGLGADETVKLLDALIPETRAYGVVSDLRYAVRGGRVPGYVRTLAGLLRITPVLRSNPDGRITSSGFLFGRKRRIKALARYVAKNAPADEPVAVLVGHAVCPDDAAELRDRLKQEIPNIERISICELGTAFGVHGGPGTLVVGIQPWRLPRRATGDA